MGAWASRAGGYREEPGEIPEGEGVDLFGPLYGDLVPPSTRKGLGEYYTPEGVAERALALLEPPGDYWRGVRVLDPACGSGVFLVNQSAH